MKRFYDGNLDLATLNDILNSRGYPNAGMTNPITAAKLNALSSAHTFATGDLVNGDIMNAAFDPETLINIGGLINNTIFSDTGAL